MNGISFLRRVIRAYSEAADPAGLGRLLFEVEKAYHREAFNIPKRGAELAVFWELKTAFAIMEDYERETDEE